MWLARTTLVKIEAGVATVGVPNAMSQEWIAAQFGDMLRRLLKEVSGLSISELRFEITSVQASE